MTPAQVKRWKPVDVVLNEGEVNQHTVTGHQFKPANVDFVVGTVYSRTEGVWFITAIAPNKFGVVTMVGGVLLDGAIDEAENILRDLGWTITA